MAEISDCPTLIAGPRSLSLSTSNPTEATIDSTAKPLTFVIVRLAAEVTQKSRRTRKRFLRQLVSNIRDALKSSGVYGKVYEQWDRIILEVEDVEGLSVLRRVFGISSYSVVAAKVPADLEAIVAAGLEVYKDRINGQTYAVTARRTGRHPFSSQDVREALGAALNHLGTVNLGNPDVEVPVEVRDREAHVFFEKVRGPGGLPIGVQGTAVCLISGGFDSAVAAWYLLKRGVRLEYVFCNLAGPAFERSVLQVTKVLTDGWSFGDRPKIHAIDFTKPLEELQGKVTPRYWQVVLKRLMYRAAETVASQVKGDAIVTGEALGQVSSQTLPNLRAIESCVELPVFRPLIGTDKNEIILRAERIGTAALSARIKEYCGILEGRPVTAAKSRTVDTEEGFMDLDVLHKAVAERRVLDLRRMGPKELTEPYIFIEDVPAKAAVLDCRFPHQDDGWRYPRSLRVAPADFPKYVDKLNKDRVHVLFCDNGVQSAQFAELLQRVGYEAYSLRGGTSTIKKLVDQKAREAAEVATAAGSEEE